MRKMCSIGIMIIIPSLIQYNDFVLNGIDHLDKSRQKMQQESSRLLSERLDNCFVPIKGRVDKFADWYFAYR